MDWLSGDIEANGIRMHYYRTGGDKPVLVLSHGATDSGLCWTRVTRALESEYDVIMPDARGHGLSEAPASGYSSTEHAADLAGLIRALHLDRPALGGHSMGAATTLKLVADQPDIARCAILEDPPLWLGAPPTPQPGKPHPREAIRQTVLLAQSSSSDEVIKRGKETNPTWDDAEFGPWADAKAHVRSQFLDALAGGPPLFQDWLAEIARVRVPLLLVTSDPDKGGIVTPEASAEAQRLLPALEVARLSGAGHNIRREQFDAFVNAVRSFLADHARPVTGPAGATRSA